MHLHSKLTDSLKAEGSAKKPQQSPAYAEDVSPGMFIKFSNFGIALVIHNLISNENKESQELGLIWCANHANNIYQRVVVPRHMLIHVIFTPFTS